MPSQSMVEQPRISRDGFQIARKVLGLCNKVDALDSDIASDAILVSIDFEHLDNFHQDLSLDLNTQTGLAILDPRNVMTSKPSQAISTFNFASGTTKYRAKAGRDFLFRRSAYIALENILNRIQSCIPSSRKIILIGHNISYDLRVLGAIAFNFQPVVAILDTMWIVTKLRGKQVSLKEALTAEGCPFDRLHCAGNDANFTLRLLLLLVVRTCPGPSRAKHRAKLEEIACDPIPHKDYPHAKAAKKKMKRLQRTRKYQSRFWDAKKRDEIRAERAAKILAKQSGVMSMASIVDKSVELAISTGRIDSTATDKQKKDRVHAKRGAGMRVWRVLAEGIFSMCSIIFNAI